MMILNVIFGHEPPHIQFLIIFATTKVYSYIYCQFLLTPLAICEEGGGLTGSLTTGLITTGETCGAFEARGVPIRRAEGAGTMAIGAASNRSAAISTRVVAAGEGWL